MLAPVRRIILLMLLALAVAGCAAPPGRDARGHPGIERASAEELARAIPKAQPKITIAELLRLTREGVAPDQIIDALATTQSRIALSAAQRAELVRQGVDRGVLDYIIAAEERAHRADVVDALTQSEATQAQIREEREHRRQTWRYRHYDHFWMRPPSWSGYWGTHRPYAGLYWYW